MLVDEVSYHFSKFLRKIKILLRQTDRTQVLRTVGILVVALAVLGTSQNGRKLEGEVAGEEIPADEGKSPNFPERGSEKSPVEPRSFPSGSEATVSASAAFVIDNETETVLFEKNANQRLPMASLTKIATAVVVLDKYQLDEVVAVPEVCTRLPPLKVGYAAGQKLTVEELLYGVLVASASDASCALSHHFDGDFLQLMNQKAEELGLERTHFENEIGLDGENGNHLSTAKDLVKLSQEALKNGVFRKIVGTAQWQGLTSTNEFLLTLPGTTGIKTGYTEQARGCLAVSYQREGREIIGVILGSNGRFADAQTILEWIFETYRWP